MKGKKALGILLAAAMTSSFLFTGVPAGAAGPVITASMSQPAYGLDTPAVATVVTSGTVEKCYLANESGMGLVSERTCKDNLDGTRTWTISLSLATKGVRTLKVMADGVDTGVTVSFSLVEHYEPPHTAPVLLRAEGPQTGSVNQPFPVTVITNDAVEYVALFNESGSGIVSTRVFSDNGDGTRTWLLMTSLATRGSRSFSVKIADASKVWQDTEATVSVWLGVDQEPQYEAAPAKSRSSVHDPSIVQDKDTGEYYIFGSNQGVAKSSDLINWSTVRCQLYGEDVASNLAGSFAWAGYKDGSTNAGNGMALWAPDVIYNPRYENADGSKGAYMIYYPVCSNHKRGAIGYAVSQNITGPYQYGDTILYSGFTLTGGPDEEGTTADTIWTRTNLPELIENGTIEGLRDSWFNEDGSYNIVDHAMPIDPAVFFDEDGRLWMVYGGAMLIELDPATGAAMYPGKDGKTEGGNDIDRYFGIRIAGGFYKGGEGAYIEYDKESGYYYLYVTYGQITEGYNQRLFRSKNVTGPYLDAKGQNAAFADDTVTPSDYGVKVMGNYKFSGMSQGYKHGGHNSIYTDENGQMYNIYHQRFERGSNHQDRIHQLFRNQAGWPVMAVYENAGDLISPTGYAMDEIVGYYEFVNHGTLSSSGMLDTFLVRLNEDGSITGDLEGRWNMTDGTYYMSAAINGVTYEGVFFKQQDESGLKRQVMTFSAIGSNNETIWGSRLSQSDRDLAAAESAANALDLAPSVHADLALRTSGDYDTRIFWTTSDPFVLTSRGVVHRQAEERPVTLTAYVMKNGAVAVRTFDVTVEAAQSGVQAFDGKPLYQFSFSNTDGAFTKNTGSLLGAGLLTGDGTVVTDSDKGLVLSTSGAGALILPGDTLSGLTEGFSVCFWVKTDGSSSLFEASGEGFSTCIGSDLRATVQANGQTIRTGEASQALPAGEWACVTYSVGRTGIDVYLNGRLVSSAKADLSFVFGDGRLNHLTVKAGGGSGAALLDDVAVYAPALTADQANAMIDPDIAWQTDWQIDFGTETSAVWGGFTQMTDQTLYKKVGLLQGYGFKGPVQSGVTPTGGAKICDFVYAKGGEKYTFQMDLPNGTYRVFMYTGAKDAINTTNFYFQDHADDVHTQVTPEGVASDNYGGPNTYTVEVTDQLLTVTIWGDASLGADAITGRLNSIEITRLS